MQFVDEISIKLKAGDGGPGIVAWRREAHVDEGGPWGGDGGKGGDIIFVGDHNVNTLFDLRNKKIIIANNGGKGGVQMASGRGAENILINIPIGTTIYDKNTNEVLCDILQPNQQFICCHGGKGGHGNAYFKNSHNRIPSLYENGDIGESAEITLKLKYVADVGFVGLPNAGKSTLISAISNAHPKTAPYQFTTLTPVLGTVIHKNNKLVFADIPGLIDGAAEGKGLGHEFLKHCERCHVLIHLISLNPEDTDDVLRDYQTISKELSCYDEVLSQKDKIIVGNKIDVPGSEKNLKVLQNKISKNIYAISGLKKENLTKFLDDVFTAYNDIVSKIPPPEVVVDPNADLKIKKYTNKSCTVTKLEEGRYAVESKYLTYWFHKIPLKTADNTLRFTQKIESSNVEKKIIGMGGHAGDTMVICGQEFIID